MDVFSTIATRIIKEQELVIGPLAWYEAAKVSGLVTDQQTGVANVTGNTQDVLNRLVMQYERLFGHASRAVCREAAQSLLADLPSAEVPANLK